MKRLVTAGLSHWTPAGWGIEPLASVDERTAIPEPPPNHQSFGRVHSEAWILWRTSPFSCELSHLFPFSGNLEELPGFHPFEAPLFSQSFGATLWADESHSEPRGR